MNDLLKLNQHLQERLNRMEAHSTNPGQASTSTACVEPTGTPRPILEPPRFPSVIYVGQFLNCNPRIEPKDGEEDYDNGAIDIKTDENQAILAAAQRNNDRLRSTIIGKSAFQWFAMDTRIKVLHDLFPDRSVVPAWNDIQREVCRRWKLLGPEDRQHYFEIAEYQHEKEIESTKDNPQQPNKPEDHQSLPTEQ